MRSDVPTECPVCRGVLLEVPRSIGNKDADRFRCHRCGLYDLTGTAEVNLRRWDELHRAALSHRIAQANQSGRTPLVTTKMLEHVEEDPSLPNAAEQADNLIRLLGDHSRPGENFPLNPEDHRSIIGALGKEGALFVIDGVHAARLIDGSEVLAGPRATRLTFAGWRRYEELSADAPIRGGPSWPWSTKTRSSIGSTAIASSPRFYAARLDALLGG